MNQTALKAAQKVGFPRDRMIGSWWTGSEEDVIPAGDAAKGYMAATWNVSGKQVPLIADIEKVVYGAGKGNLQDASKIGTVLYNRGVSAAFLSVEAIRKAQDKYGKGKAMTGEQVRWALENLNITDARLKAAGRPICRRKSRPPATTTKARARCGSSSGMAPSGCRCRAGSRATRP